MTSVDYWFDPVCPWSWTTSRWVREVVAQSDVEVQWRPMSLAILNASDDPAIQRFTSVTIEPARVCAVVYQNEPELLGELYRQLGERFHHAGDEQERMRFGSFAEVLEFYPANRELIRSKVADALAATGLAASYLDAVEDPKWDEVLEQSHASVPAGNQNRELIGVPTLSVEGSAGVFGPVISEVPTGEQVLELWNAFVAMAKYQNFFELKRTTDRPAPLTEGSPFGAAASGACAL